MVTLKAPIDEDEEEDDSEWKSESHSDYEEEEEESFTRQISILTAFSAIL